MIQTNTPMIPCSHEEADSRMCLNVKDTLEKGAHKKFVQTVDTDIIVILTDTFLSCKCISRPSSLGQFWDWQVLQILLHQ